ncbi:hypothetical protein BG006_010017 [Podila minutissima]|uniref:Threonine/serine exporter-like N-terminal domain-containing protein n=1 Tax=Podila minutissima TaxID=64525 RepID=A0A9P5SDT2_9FUNG|nr:hypothetical protein BG006_010017 [Podila minutissima]
MAVADILERQDYILRLAKSMIKYGAPSHRLEDAIDHSARHLELNLQCVYLPNVMIVAFTDYETHTSETHLLKVAADLDMYKCALVHQVHKMVTHESMPVEEAITKLQAISSEKDANPRWATILAYATAGLCTAPMCFSGSWVDAGVGFLLGGAVGLMVWLAEKVPSYARICEITMSVVVVFVAEALYRYLPGSFSILGRNVGGRLEMAQGLLQVVVELYVGCGDVGMDIGVVGLLEGLDRGLVVAQLEVSDAHVVVSSS